MIDKLAVQGEISMGIDKKTFANVDESIVHRSPFVCASMSGGYLSNGLYVVYSYKEPIAVAMPLEGTAEWVITLDKYSVTTSRHTNVVKRALGQSTVRHTVYTLESGDSIRRLMDSGACS